MNLNKIITYVFLSIFVYTGSAFAQSDPEAIASVTHKISGEVMSPFCPGRSLNDCPSSSATELRNQISSMLTEGRSEDEVKNELFRKYGDEIRAMPKAEGFGLVGWISPLIFLLAGLVVLVSFISRHRPSQTEPASSTAISPEMLKRIEEEVSGKH